MIQVSAASICAKVPRDKILQNWVFEDHRLSQNRDWGCGYPSDELTKQWMRDHLHPVFGWPDLVRFSWGPAKDVRSYVLRYCVCLHGPTDSIEPIWIVWIRFTAGARQGSR